MSADTSCPSMFNLLIVTVLHGHVFIFCLCLFIDSFWWGRNFYNWLWSILCGFVFLWNYIWRIDVMMIVPLIYQVHYFQTFVLVAIFELEIDINTLPYWGPKTHIFVSDLSLQWPITSHFACNLCVLFHSPDCFNQFFFSGDTGGFSAIIRKDTTEYHWGQYHCFRNVEAMLEIIVITEYFFFFGSKKKHWCAPCYEEHGRSLQNHRPYWYYASA